jgi:hypothetical protein
VVFLDSLAVRFIVDLTPVEDRVEGVVDKEGSPDPHPFSGWLELLRLLEADLVADPRPPVDGAA